MIQSPLLSLPVRGAWVEIHGKTGKTSRTKGRSPCGERGLKWLYLLRNNLAYTVAPRAGSVG